MAGEEQPRWIGFHRTPQFWVVAWVCEPAAHADAQVTDTEDVPVDPNDLSFAPKEFEPAPLRKRVEADARVRWAINREVLTGEFRAYTRCQLNGRYTMRSVQSHSYASPQKSTTRRACLP